jgi:DNA repair protein RecN (Recombination protein N)
MLTSLKIRNLAIVDNIEVGFGAGLNVITGETGAGKSILAAALGLVLGGRADRSMIRAGEDKCSVEAVFELNNTDEINAILDDGGIDECDGGLLIIRRVISEKGAGRNFINGCQTTVQTLKNVGNLLVDMHGPYDHQSLLNRDFQMDILDAYGHLAGQLQSYAKIYANLLELQRRRESLDSDSSSTAQQMDLLSFQVKELEEADLDGLDEDELVAEHSRVANAERILELTDGLLNAITEDETSAFNAVAFGQRTIPELVELVPQAADWRDELESVSVQLQELTNAISGFSQGVEADPERLLWLEDRMALLQKLKRKYGSTIPEMLEFLEKARGRLSALENRDEILRKLDAEIEQSRRATMAAGEKLRSARQKAAAKLGKAITGHLRDLGFQHGEFSIEVNPALQPGPSGIDVIEFGFAPNLGEPMRPLRDIASSGEISRVMLAIKAVLAKHDRIPVLVFDEIDSNVGGEMGNAIGSKLATVAELRQVICITHLPQVAAFGTQHFVVAKQVRDSRTLTSITEVDGDDRAEEVARMLGGRDLTSVALQHARELLQGKNA